MFRFLWKMMFVWVENEIVFDTNEDENKYVYSSATVALHRGLRTYLHKLSFLFKHVGVHIQKHFQLKKLQQILQEH